MPVTTVGSWPRPRELLLAQRELRRGQGDAEACQRLADEAVLDVLARQEAAGVDVVTDGEQRRDNFYSFVADKLDGVQLMSMLELLDVVDDKQGFEQLLQTLDVPASSLLNPTCVGKLKRRKPLAVDELRFLQAHTGRPIKIPLPGPYLLTRAMYVKEATRAFYPSKEALGADVVAILRAELEDLAAAGAAIVQFDEPVLTEVAFSPGRTRTFMCASLAARGDPKEELDLAVELMEAVVKGISGPTLAVHVCRGNWSQDESILLRGDYHPLARVLERLPVDQLVLEYATERAGDLMRFGDKTLGLGVVNPRSERVESVDEIVASIERALRLYRPDQLSLNPDCGFGTFSSSPVNSAAIAGAKMQAIAEAARQVRDRL